MAFSCPVAYAKFEREIKSDARYIYSDETLAFIAEVVATSGKRTHVLKAGSIFSRAQIGHDWQRKATKARSELRRRTRRNE